MREPSAWSSAWQCGQHGEVDPLRTMTSPSAAGLEGLWLILWPDTAGVLLVEALELRDLRDPGQDLDLPFGAPSPRLPG